MPYLNFRHRAVLLASLFALGMAPSAAAQLHGRVVDPSATPLPGALVEIWSPTTRLGGQLTDQRGEFLFGNTATETAVLLIVRRIGYRPARVPLPQPAPVAIVLVPFAEQLPAITASVAPLCPNREDRAARALWDALRRRYRPFKPDAGYWSDIRVVAARVSVAQLGLIDTTQATDGQVAAGGRYFDMQTQRVARSGYATSYQGSLQQRFDRWEYARLESFFAGHFLDSLFGRLHRFSIEPRSPFVLVFCPRDTNRPSIQGRLELEADTSLGRASWVFGTLELQEEAGGEVIFSRPGKGAANPVLLPLVGLFWRKLVVDYYQEWMQYEDWRTCADHPDSHFCR